MAGHRGRHAHDRWPARRAQCAPRSAEVTVRQAVDLRLLDRYQQIHREHVARQPSHALHSRVEAVEDLQRWLEAGTLFEVLVDGRWARVLAGEPRVVHGMRGPTVTEVLLDPAVRGRGYGKHLSALLARNLTLPDDEILAGTIHVDNTPSMRSALAAGRVDVGGEITIPLDQP